MSDRCPLGYLFFLLYSVFVGLTSQHPLEFLPFANLDFCFQDILKSFIARSFKLGQLIGDEE